MQVYSGYTRLQNLGNGLCLTVPNNDYTNLVKMVYVNCTDPDARDMMLPQPGVDLRMFIAGAANKCMDTDTDDTGVVVSGAQCPSPPFSQAQWEVGGGGEGGAGRRGV
jgi:hypothetical protein